MVVPLAISTAVSYLASQIIDFTAQKGIGNIKRPFEISQHILQAHCQSPTSQRYNQSFVKELAKPTQGKIELKKISPPSKNKKYTYAQTNSTTKMTAKRNNDNGLQTRRTRTPAPNSSYPKVAVQWLN